MIFDSRTAVGRVRRTVGVEHFAHYKISARAIGVWVDRYGLEQAVGVVTRRLIC